MKIAGSPSPPSRVLVVGDDHAGANIHMARPQNTSRTTGSGPGRSRRASRQHALPAGLGALLHRGHDLGRGRDGLFGRRPDG